MPTSSREDFVNGLLGSAVEGLFPGQNGVLILRSVAARWGTDAHPSRVAHGRVGGRRASGRRFGQDHGSRSVEITESDSPSGHGATKKASGRKRHIVVYSEGMMLGALIHEASLQISDGVLPLLSQMHRLAHFLN